jgi:hypothetical protein
MHAPTDSHWAAVKRILRYLKGTTTHGLHITNSSFFPLHGFTNADYAGSIDDKKNLRVVILCPLVILSNV